MDSIRYAGASSNVPQPQPTERNMELIRQRMAKRAAFAEPLEGDFVRLNDGRTARICHCWEDTIQTTTGGSYYICKGGGCEYSGTLYPGVARDSLVPTNGTQVGQVWFFHHDSAGAHLGVFFDVPMRVWALKPGTDDRHCLSF
jgi:hypothetical protein